MDEVYEKFRDQMSAAGRSPDWIEDVIESHATKRTKERATDRLREAGRQALADELEAREAIAADPLRAAAVRENARPRPGATSADIADQRDRLVERDDDLARERFRAQMASHGIRLDPLERRRGTGSIDRVIAERAATEQKFTRAAASPSFDRTIASDFVGFTPPADWKSMSTSARKAALVTFVSQQGRSA